MIHIKDLRKDRCMDNFDDLLHQDNNSHYHDAHHINRIKHGSFSYIPMVSLMIFKFR